MPPIEFPTAPTTDQPESVPADVLVLAVAWALLLPSLPYALHRLVPLLLTRSRHPAHSVQDASLALAAAVALAVYTITALVALAPSSSWTAAVASGAFGCWSVVLMTATAIAVNPTSKRGRAPDGSPSCRSRRVQIGAILASSIGLDVLSVAFPVENPYPRLPSSSAGQRAGTLAPTLLGPTTSSPAAYLVIALFAATQSLLLTAYVRGCAIETALVQARTTTRSTRSLDSSFIEITLPQPSLATRPTRSRILEEESRHPELSSTQAFGSPSSSPLSTQIKSLPTSQQPTLTPDVVVQSPGPARSTPTPRSHRSLPPLTIGVQLTPVSQGPEKRNLAARPSTASTTASFARPSTASTTLSRRPLDEQSTRPPGSTASSSPTQYRSGSRFSFRQVRSGSCSSSVGRLSSVPSLTRLSTIFNGAPAATATTTTGVVVPAARPSVSPSTPTRRRSSSVGSLLRSVVPSPPASANSACPASLTEWEIEPNEALDDPFARPPPTTPSTPTSSTPAPPTATPTRAEAQTFGSLARSRLVRALEAIEEPENGSPPDPSSLVHEEEEGESHGHGEAATRPSSEGRRHLEQVLTPMPLARSGEERWPHSTDSTMSSSSGSCEACEGQVPKITPPALRTGASVFGLELSTPTAEHRTRLPRDSPPRRRTDRRAPSPLRSIDPFDFPSPRSPGEKTGSSPMSPNRVNSSTLTRNRSSSLRLFAHSLASSGSARLVALRRIRSSLRRRSHSPSPHGTDARPSESSELSFSCLGAEASVPDLRADAEAERPPRSDEVKLTKPVTPPGPIGLAPPAPESARLSVGSRKAWWKHLSTAGHPSSLSESRNASDGSGCRSSFLLLPQQLSASSVSLACSASRFGAGDTISSGTSAAANARWSGCQLPPLNDVSPLNSSLFLPEGIRRSNSSTRKGLRRTESSPAMIGHVPSIPDSTVMSFAASSKFSSASFVTAQSTTGRLDPSLPDPTLGIELDELDHLVDTFVPSHDAVSSAPSSVAALTPRSPLFGSPLTSSAVDEEHDLISPITPATPSEFGCPIVAWRSSFSEGLAN
ncbi:hypothetical protein JCM3774_004696 [Rhodotorula dairenensis]